MSRSSAESEPSLLDNLLHKDFNKTEIELQDLYEDSSVGKIQGSIFLKYLLAGGNWCIVSFVIFLLLLTQVVVSGTDYFLTHWVNVEEDRTKFLLSDDTIDEQFSGLSTNTSLTIYGVLLIVILLIAISRSIAFFKLVTRASIKLHNSMLVRVIYTTMRFFETNPSGRILNRFSKDVGTMDELLPKALLDAVQILLMGVGSIILVSVVDPYLFVVAVFICAFFMLSQFIFLKTSKNIKRLEGMTRSPVFTHLNASLQGLSTIRACGAEEMLKKEFDKHQNLHTGAWFMYITAGAAFSFSIDLLCCIFTAITTFIFVIPSKKMSGGNVGLAITQAITLMSNVQFGMRQSTDAGNQLVAVERVLEYTLLPSEKQPEISKKPKKNEWPKNGYISFLNVNLRYSDDSEIVLKNLNFTIRGKEKIGVVGRTGAGKSSLITALFRLAIIEGDIEIDGISTKDLSLEILRSRISIIPQDPVLFSGTLRYNLDPFEEYTDTDLYLAIRAVKLNDPTNTINRLESYVMNGGANYSVGQRQLLCLARAIIRRNKILILDEATANVDPQTDVIIQKTIREEFAECTVITIAHRLNTIMDSDKVLLIDSGEIAEFSHPHLLLQNQNGAFYKMVAETGTVEELENVARRNYEKNHLLSKID